MSFVIAASEEYLSRCGAPQTPEDLAQHDCIMVGNGQSWHLAGPNGNVEIPARVVLRFGSSMSVAVAHAVCAGIGLAPLPRMVFEGPMFKDVLRPVLVTHPLRHPHLYALYVNTCRSRYAPSSITSLNVPACRGHGRVRVTVEEKRTIHSATPVMRLVPGK
jgi:DNA-binding transcriptional LysR family regulator